MDIEKEIEEIIKLNPRAIRISALDSLLRAAVWRNNLEKFVLIVNKLREEKIDIEQYNLIISDYLEVAEKKQFKELIALLKNSFL
jgi:hypothetical protein